MGKYYLPGVLTAVPSAMVLTVGSVVTFPASKDAFIQLAPAGSTPMTLIFGFNSFARVDTPVASPPPPIGTKIYSTIRQFFKNLHGNRSLSGCYCQIIKWMYECIAVFSLPVHMRVHMLHHTHHHKEQLLHHNSLYGLL